MQTTWLFAVKRPLKYSAFHRDTSITVSSKYQGNYGVTRTYSCSQILLSFASWQAIEDFHYTGNFSTLLTLLFYFVSTESCQVSIRYYWELKSPLMYICARYYISRAHIAVLVREESSLWCQTRQPSENIWKRLLISSLPCLCWFTLFEQGLDR